MDLFANSEIIFEMYLKDTFVSAILGGVLD
jgi:hypothetical protein